MLKDKVAIVTGSIRGIGLVTAKEFASPGATVIVCSRSMAGAEKSASMIMGKADPERPDVTDAAGVTNFMRQVVDRHRRVDILVNNAGYPFDRSALPFMIEKGDDGKLNGKVGRPNGSR